MNILEEIIEYKKEEVKSRKAIVKTADLEKRELFSRTVLPLKDFLLDRSRTGIIAEFKRRSPSKGVINPDVDVLEVTKGYTEHGASCLSVLTDEHFFGGSDEDLIKARINKIPILRKDFVIMNTS
jgi:indole-3-glycerol phosphate synthase